MSESKILIGNKQVYKSSPFIPGKPFEAEIVGRDIELKLITAAWITGGSTLPLNPLLIGEPGVGKNRLVYEIAQRTNQNLFIFQGHEDVSAEDLACSVRFSDKSNVMDYILSPLVSAMLEGGILFIDEIGKIRPRALSLLVSVLDERRYIDSTLLGERIYAHPAFRFIAATNSTDINLMPEFILSRMKPVIKVSYPEKKEIEQIIKSQFQSNDSEMKKLLVFFWFLWEGLGDKKIKLSPRDAIYIFGLASNFSVLETLNSSDEPTLLDESDDKTTKSISHKITQEHLKLAFDRFFENPNFN